MALLRHAAPHYAIAAVMLLIRFDAAMLLLLIDARHAIRASAPC